MNNTNPFFSIVIPTYNHAHLIRKCLESVLNQSFVNWEAIVVNNFSQDNTIEIVENYNDKRIRLINYSNNGIIAVSRNKGISETKGEWICFLDSDDWWYPSKLKVIYDSIQDNNHVDVICHDLVSHITHTGKEEYLLCGPISPNLYQNLLLFGNRFYNSALSVRKSTIQINNVRLNEDVGFVTVEDYDFTLQLAFNNAIFRCINIPLGGYLITNNNLSSSNVHFTNTQNLLKYQVYEIQNFDKNHPRLWKKVSSRLYLIKASISLAKHDYFISLYSFIISLLLSPRNFFVYLDDKFKRVLRNRKLIRQ